MNKEQQIVVEWMQRVLAERKLTPQRWAEAAGVATTSITRAMQPSYNGTTSLPLLHRLARAAGVPSPLDFLAERTHLPGEAELLAAIRGVLAIQESGAIDAGLLARVISRLLRSPDDSTG